MKIYKTIIRPAVTYAAENMCLTKKDEERLKRFERKVIKKIYGLKRVNGENRQLTNNKIEQILEKRNIVRHIKSRRMKWFGHVQRRDDLTVIKRVLNWKPQTQRGAGRPRIRWIGQVQEDLRRMKVGDWRRQIMDRETWRGFTDTMETHEEL